MLKGTVLLVLHRLYNNNNRNLWKDLNKIKVLRSIGMERDYLLLIADLRVNAKQKLYWNKEGNIEVFKLNDNDIKGKCTSIKQKKHSTPR